MSFSVVSGVKFLFHHILISLPLIPSFYPVTVCDIDRLLTNRCEEKNVISVELLCWPSVAIPLQTWNNSSESVFFSKP